MNCNYKVKITDIQNKYQFKILCKGGANSTNVNDIYNLLPTTTTEGANINIANTSDIKAKSISIKGNTTQDGTPTPASPVDVKVVTGNNTLKVCNKNLFDKDNVSSLNASINSSGTISSNSNCKTIIIPIKANTTYTIQKIASTQFRTSVYDSSPAIGSTGTNTKSNFTGTTITIESTTNSQYLAVFCYINTDTVSYQDILNGIQIEVGSTATSYVPHQEKDFIINFGNLEFCKIGNYADYPFKENGKWYKYGAISKVVLNGTTNNITSKSGNTSNNTYISSVISDILAPTSNGAVIPLLCSHYTTSASTDYIVTHNILGIAVRTDKKLAIGETLESTNTTVELMNTWLQTHNVSLYYPLATPTITEITDTTLIKQLNNIYNNIRTFEGGTNISSTSAGANPIINITTFNKLS